MKELTSNQMDVLESLKNMPKTTWQVTWSIIGLTVDAAHGRLRRLEDAEYVRRIGKPAKWELTAKGRKALIN